MDHEERNLLAKVEPAPLTVWNKMQRSALITGITAGNLVLFGTIVSRASFVGDALGIILATSIVFGSIGAGVAALTGRRRKPSIEALEVDLHRATQMMERRLINEQEYLALKARLIHEYRPATPGRTGTVITVALLSMLVGLTLSQLGLAFDVAWNAGELILATVVITGGGAFAGGAASLGLQRLRYRLEHPALSAPTDHLRLDDPALRDRPLLKG
jgi:hypothetical protein